MSPLPEVTELLQPTVVRFPRARLSVVKGPSAGAEVVLEGQTVLVGSDETCQLVLADSSVSRRHLELSGGLGGYRIRDLRSTNGVYVDGIQVVEARLNQKVRIRVGRSELRFEPERQEVQWPLSAAEQFGSVWGKSAAMRRVFALLERAAPTDSFIVLEGETGTGKELLARNIHQQSARANQPFVALDLSSLTEALMESDVFGHDAGAFGGTRLTRLGALEEAHQGTLFLDEICELPPPLQARLLRTIESREIKRPDQSVPIDVRLIASTRKDLEVEVKAGRFREDLFFKLSVFRMRVPALRERAEDIPTLVRQFASKFPEAQPLSEETIEMLTRHDWAGNVRELRSVVERLCAFPDLGMAALGGALGGSEQEPSIGSKLRSEIMMPLMDLPYHEAKERVVESFERTYLTEQLRACGGVVTRAAQKAGLPRQSVHRMLRRLGMGSHEE